jgi:hypothetical protein
LNDLRDFVVAYFRTHRPLRATEENEKDLWKKWRWWRWFDGLKFVWWDWMKPQKHSVALSDVLFRSKLPQTPYPAATW